MSKYKVCFMGTPELARTVLEALVTSGEYDVVLCCCQPDKPVGRKKIITPPPTKVYATSMGIECFQPDSMRTDEAYEKNLGTYGRFTKEEGVVKWIDPRKE